MSGRHSAAHRLPRWEVAPALVGLAYLATTLAYLLLGVTRCHTA